MVIEEIRDLSFDRPKRLGACRRGIACGAKAIKWRRGMLRYLLNIAGAAIVLVGALILFTSRLS